MIQKYAKLLKLLDQTENYELAKQVEEIIIKKAQQKQLSNVLKWKYLNRTLKQKFKNLRELIATKTDVFGEPGTKAVNQMGYWIKYVDDIQADPIDENPYKTQYDDETIANGTRWWETILPILKPIENLIYGSKANELNDRFKNTYNQVKAEITNLLNGINAITQVARQEFAQFFAQG